MSDSFDPTEMIRRYQERAVAVKQRNLPPVGLEDRNRFLEQQQLDYMDFAMIGDAQATIEDGFLVLRVDLRPPE